MRYPKRELVSSGVEGWRKSSPPIITPNELTNVQLWLDAADASTITESSGSVSQWNNKGLLGNFTSSGAAQPTTGASTLNGLNVLDFASDYFTAANANEWKFLHDGTKYIVAVVVKFGIGSNPDIIYGVFGSCNDFAEHGIIFAYDDRSGLSRNNTYLMVVANAASPSPVSIASQNRIIPNVFNVITFICDPSNGTANNRHEFFINGTTGFKGNTGTGTPSSSNPTRTFQVGAIGSNGSPLTGSIGEIIVATGADATEENRVSLRDYLTNKWNVL
jgi:hypothetical protein